MHSANIVLYSVTALFSCPFWLRLGTTAMRAFFLHDSPRPRLFSCVRTLSSGEAWVVVPDATSARSFPIISYLVIFIFRPIRGYPHLLSATWFRRRLDVRQPSTKSMCLPFPDFRLLRRSLHEAARGAAMACYNDG